MAEKPSVAREIARIVGAMKREEGYFTGNGYHMCVGCGRCDDVCPEYISFSGCVNHLEEAMVEVTEK